MRRLPRIFIILFVGLGFYLGLVPEYKFKYYYYLRDSTRILSRVTYPNEFFLKNDTYLVPGFYDKHQVPKTYVKPTLSSDGDWAEYVTFHSNGILIIGFPAETKNLSNDFRYFEGSFTYYSDALKLDSLEASLKDTQKIALYTYDK
jgi:hypothetical protein